MDKNKKNTLRRSRRKAGIRKRVFGTPERPRLSIFRSSKHVYAQLIDDYADNTLAEASTVSIKLEQGGTVSAAAEIGKAIADKAKGIGIDAVAFDRNGFRYHGRVKALADAAREAGLKF